MMNTAEIAVKALQILDEDGWCKGSVEADPNGYAVIRDGFLPGSHCLGGAWNEAFRGNSMFSEKMSDYRPLTEVILDQYPDLMKNWGPFYQETSVIIAMNDRNETTETDVRAILEKLAQEGNIS